MGSTRVRNSQDYLLQSYEFLITRPHAFIAPAFWPLSPLLKTHSYSLNSH